MGRSRKKIGKSNSNKITKKLVEKSTTSNISNRRKTDLAISNEETQENKDEPRLRRSGRNSKDEKDEQNKQSTSVCVVSRTNAKMQKKNNCDGELHPNRSSKLSLKTAKSVQEAEADSVDSDEDEDETMVSDCDEEMSGTSNESAADSDWEPECSPSDSKAKSHHKQRARNSESRNNRKSSGVATESQSSSYQNGSNANRSSKNISRGKPPRNNTSKPKIGNKLKSSQKNKDEEKTVCSLSPGNPLLVSNCVAEINLSESGSDSEEDLPEAKIVDKSSARMMPDFTIAKSAIYHEPSNNHGNELSNDEPPPETQRNKKHKVKKDSNVKQTGSRKSRRQAVKIEDAKSDVSVPIKSEKCPTKMNVRKQTKKLKTKTTSDDDFEDESFLSNSIGTIEECLPSSSKGRRVSAAHGSDTDEDWEDVEEIGAEDNSSDDVNVEKALKAQLPDMPVEITLEGPDFMRKKKKKEFSMNDWIRRKINRVRKEARLDLHKVHLMCLVGNGCWRNQVCTSPLLHAVALSIMPSKDLAKEVKRWKQSDLQRIIDRMQEHFAMATDLSENHEDWEATLLQRFEERRVASYQELAMVYVLVLRALGAEVRLVVSLQPVSIKPEGQLKQKPVLKVAAGESKECISTNTDVASEKKEIATGVKKESAAEKLEIKETLKKQSSTGASRKRSRSKPGNKSLDNSVSKLEGNLKCKDKKVKKESKQLKTKSKCPEAESVEHKSKYFSDDQKSPLSAIRLLRKRSKHIDYVNEESEVSEREGAETRTGRKRRKITDAAIANSDEEFEPEKSFRSPTNLRKKSSGGADIGDEDMQISSEDEFEPEKEQQKSGKTSRRRTSASSSTGVKVIKEKLQKKGGDDWIEVYLVSEKQWIAVDCHQGKLGNLLKIEEQATKPLHYVMAFDNDGHVKDVTSRYNSQPSSRMRRIRVDQSWLDQMLVPLISTKETDLARIEAEDKQIQNAMLKSALPSSIGEFKNHPLYVLQRHLLKFEAIYPPDAAPVGFMRKEPVYARECVHQLHTRETWLREALSVKSGEEPYKIVKGRKKRSRREPNPIGPDPMVAVFGMWQTEDYVPPPVVDGVIVKNDYGNVDLFKPSMIPAGAVHLRLNGLNKIARKLHIDVGEAMVGWDFHGGWNHPVMDGFIVPAEHADTLRDAWAEEQHNMERRQREKREQRVLGNWILLVKGVFIREKLKRRYSLKEPTVSKPGTSKDAVECKSKEMSAPSQLSWPRNKMSDKTLSQSSLFPFEVENL